MRMCARTVSWWCQSDAWVPDALVSPYQMLNSEKSRVQKIIALPDRTHDRKCLSAMMGWRTILGPLYLMTSLILSLISGL